MIDFEQTCLTTIYENPDDGFPKLVFADWLEEYRDSYSAEAWRLLGNETYKPLASKKLDGCVEFGWWHEEHLLGLSGPEDLPPQLFDLLITGTTRSAVVCFYPSRSAAEEAFVLAWRTWKACQDQS